MAQGTPAVGSILKIGASTATPLPAVGSDTMTAVPLIDGLVPPEYKRKVQSFSTLDQPAPTAFGGVIELQKCSFNIVVDVGDTQHQRIKADASSAANVKRNYQITYPDGTHKLDFHGFVSSYGEEAFNADGIIKAKVEVTVDGSVTATP